MGPNSKKRLQIYLDLTWKFGQRYGFTNNTDIFLLIAPDSVYLTRLGYNR